MMRTQAAFAAREGAAPTARPSGEGPGLGLSLSHGIVVAIQYGRTPTVDREAGRYIECVVILPRHLAAEEAA